MPRKWSLLLLSSAALVASGAWVPRRTDRAQTRFRLVYIIVADLRGAPEDGGDGEEFAEEFVKRHRPKFENTGVDLRAAPLADSSQACAQQRDAESCDLVILRQQIDPEDESRLVVYAEGRMVSRGAVAHRIRPRPTWACDVFAGPQFWRTCRQSSYAFLTKSLKTHSEAFHPAPPTIGE